MGRPEKPVDPDAGPVQRLAWQLRQVRASAGNPSYRALGRKAHFSASTLADATKGERLPSREVTLAFVAACGGDLTEWETRWSATSQALAADTRWETPDRCPYQGLAPLEAEHADRFFGRVGLLDRLLDRVARLPLLAVFGPSGSGKSSLLRAGLIGRLSTDPRHAGQWRTLVMTPGEQPMDALAHQVAKLSGTDVGRVREALATDPAALDVALRAALSRGPESVRLLLVVDQFEEIFTVCQDAPVRARFLRSILDAIQSRDRRVTVVLGVRADVLGRMAESQELVDALGDEAYLLVGPVTAADLREIITGPAALAGLSVAPELVATIVADADDQPGALPLVSHALQETWRHQTRMGRNAVLTVAAYEASGGVRGAIAQTAEQVYAEFVPAEQAAARRIFLRLTALGEGVEDTRRPIARTELDGLAEPRAVDAVLAGLAKARLVVLGTETVDVAHEALVRAWPRLRRWLTDDRATLVVHRRLTDATRIWDQLGGDAGALYRGAQLVVAQAWTQDHPGELNQRETAFLRASSDLAEAEAASDRRRARLFQRLVAAVSILLVLAAAGGALALAQRQQAQRRQVVALADELSLRARSLLATDSDLAGLLAVQADRLSSDPETRGAVLSVAAAPVRTEFNVGGPVITTLAFNADHSVLASAAGTGAVDLWNPTTGARTGTLSGLTGRATSVAFSGDGALVAAAGAGAIILWDAGTHRVVQQLAEPQLGSAMAYSLDGTKLAVSVGAGDIALYDVRTGARRLLHLHPTPLTSLSFSADGTMLASASGTGDPVVWNVASGAVLTQITAPHAYTVAFALTGYVLAASADELGVYMWDLAGGQATRLPDLPLSGRYGWSISAPTRDVIAVADEAGTITVWDIRRRTAVEVFRDRGRSETVSVAISPDGALLSSAGFNGTIIVHDLQHTPFASSAAKVTDVKVSPDGQLVATAGDDNAVRLWDTHGTLLSTLDGHPDQVASVSFSPDSRLLAAVTRNMTLTIWDVPSRLRVIPTLRPNTLGASTEVAFNPAGTMLAVATLGPYLWDVRDLQHPVDRSTSIDRRLTTTIAFTLDGRHLIGTSVGGLINVWDLSTGKIVNRFDSRQGALQDLALSPNGRVLATAGDSRTITLWDMTTVGDGAALHPLAVLTGHTAPIQVLAFSRDGRTLASAGDDHMVMVWDVASPRLLGALTGHTERIRGLAFAPDGTLISGAEDGRIIDWTLDLPAAVDRICARVGRSLTPQEWSIYLPTQPYEQTCPGRI